MLDIALYNARQHRQFQHDRGPLLLARSQDGGPLWLPVDQDRTHTAQALMEIVPVDNGIRLQMAGCEKECYCGQPCELVGSCHLELPAQFTVGDTRFEVTSADVGSASSSRPLEVLVTDQSDRSTSTTSRGPSAATLSRWFDALGTLHRWANSSQEFFVQAARCAVDSIGLDGAVALRRRDAGWEIVASHLPHPELGIHCDMAALDQLIVTPRTLFHGAGRNGAGDTAVEGAAELTEMLTTLRIDDGSVDGGTPGPANGPSPDDVAIVVSPLFNSAHELAGAIYGFRSVRAGNARRGIRYLEAHLIELLANAVSEGIARLEHEAEVDRRRVLLEQAFAATVNQDPSRMTGERREITLLFADLRGFSAITGTLGIEQTFELLGDVMDALTAAVMDHDGVIIDYFGDGLAAMWNAPASQPDHAELACRAALRMIETLPAVGEKWSEVLTSELRLGIGVHTGEAQVGNAGSNRRMKYGPRGASVHLASRVEAATKALGTPVLVTGVTAARLSSRLDAHRLCRAQLPGINGAVELFGVGPPSSDPVTCAELANYQRALELFEQGKLADAAKQVAMIESADDRVPTKFLADQIQQALGQQQNRRSTDGAAQGPGPVITLNVK